MPRHDENLPSNTVLLQGTLDMLILKVAALGRFAYRTNSGIEVHCRLFL
jgi:hypothetical protein